jgi:hypothetical protein
LSGDENEIDMSDEVGPVEYIVVACEGNRFNGEIIPALSDLLDQGLIRIIDLAVISKDEDGTVVKLEASELSADLAAGLVKFNGELTGLLSEEDLTAIGEMLENNTTAAAMLFEHVWATRFARAVRNAHGELMSNVRIPHDVIEAARESLLEAAAAV